MTCSNLTWSCPFNFAQGTRRSYLGCRAAILAIWRGVNLAHGQLGAASMKPFSSAQIRQSSFKSLHAAAGLGFCLAQSIASTQALRSAIAAVSSCMFLCCMSRLEGGEDLG